ncbi:hypothetical protein CDD83_4225 [Cordyceps sp. RAO-2017]|nr:hypothetical protein CDD83_4225 [Cordyceps sp. RAO-2017]
MHLLGRLLRCLGRRPSRDEAERQQQQQQLVKPPSPQLACYLLESPVELDILILQELPEYGLYVLAMPCRPLRTVFAASCSLGILGVQHPYDTYARALFTVCVRVIIRATSLWWNIYDVSPAADPIMCLASSRAPGAYCTASTTARPAAQFQWSQARYRG